MYLKLSDVKEVHLCTIVWFVIVLRDVCEEQNVVNSQPCRCKTFYSLKRVCVSDPWWRGAGPSCLDSAAGRL